MKIDKLIFENEDWILFREEECADESIDIVFVFGHIIDFSRYGEIIQQKL